MFQFITIDREKERERARYISKKEPGDSFVTQFEEKKKQRENKKNVYFSFLKNSPLSLSNSLSLSLELSAPTHSMQKSPRMVPGSDASGLVAPISLRPVATTALPSQTMATTGALLLTVWRSFFFFPMRERGRRGRGNVT